MKNGSLNKRIDRIQDPGADKLPCMIFTLNTDGRTYKNNQTGELLTRKEFEEYEANFYEINNEPDDPRLVLLRLHK